MKYDFFVSHASEDKEEVVRPLVSLLKSRGFTVWYDEDVLRIGDSLSTSIDRGLAESRFGLVVLSQAFFAKHWTRKELQGLVALETDGRHKIWPIWHKVSREDVVKFSPTLADVIAGRTEHGLAPLVDAITLSANLEARPAFAEEELPRVETTATQVGPRAVAGRVVYVHGLFTSSSSTTGLPWIAHATDDPLFSAWEFMAFQYAGRLGSSAANSIDATAAQLVKSVDASGERLGKLVLVAHSVGGLIAMEAVLSSRTLREQLKAFVPIAVPTAGLQYAGLLGFLDRGLRDLRVGGKKIASINARWAEIFGDTPPFAIESVLASRDPIVSSNAAPLPGSRVTVVQASHSDVHRQPAIVEVLRRVLREASA
jgi:pimeloyl-ACP methyl ester carboxylesterase